MNVVGSAAGTEKPVMKQSAVKIWAKTARSIAARHRREIDDIRNIYHPMGFSNFKIEGRGLGSALILEFLLYYMTKPEYQIHVREKIYLDSMLDLF